LTSAHSCFFPSLIHKSDRKMDKSSAMLVNWNKVYMVQIDTTPLSYSRCNTDSTTRLPKWLLHKLYCLMPIFFQMIWTKWHYTSIVTMNLSHLVTWLYVTHVHGCEW
jgi:hypothetical protein